jgi:CRP-like cAMP-binding protein
MGARWGYNERAMGKLTACPLFEGLPGKELRAIENEFKEITQPAGSNLILEGGKGVGFMVLLDGDATVHTHDGRTWPLKPGAFMGEMALLDRGARSATVRADTDVTLATLPAWSFKAFMTAHPEVLYRLLETVSSRLRKAEDG